MSDALAICKSAIETNNPTIVSDYTLKLEPEFREIRVALEKKDVRSSATASFAFDCIIDAYIYLQEKTTETDTTGASQKTNGFTPSDPFGSGAAASTGFATDFSVPSGGAFDDSFGSAFKNQQSARRDDTYTAAAAASATSTSNLSADPFGDKSGNKAVTPDVSY